MCIRKRPIPAQLVVSSENADIPLTKQLSSVHSSAGIKTQGGLWLDHGITFEEGSSVKEQKKWWN